MSAQSMTPHVLVTVPVYNEAPRLRGTIARLSVALDASGLQYILAVAEDGSTDGTKEVLVELRREYPALLVQEIGPKWGRGRALRNLWSLTPAEIYCFIDTDLAMGTAPLLRAIELIDAGENVVVGSRYVDGAHVIRPRLRALTSRLYNGMVRAAFDDGILDHQCGLKAFSRDAFGQLRLVSLERTWFWDTEILVMARRLGIRVREIPVDWVESKYQQTSIRRLFSDVYIHGSGLIRLRANVARLGERPWRSKSVACSGATNALEPSR